MHKINIIELFSGIGGFSKGLQDAGFSFDNHYFSEIDKHAIANYKYNFKNAKYIGSVTDVRGGRGGGHKIKKPHIITFGSPCQDFSLAGKRKGMEGQRSSLILHAIRLIRELRPNFFIWENVKGTFSSNDGADFWAIISAFANIGGYRLEWQLLNTSWFLPQNRERIYLIGHLADARRDFKGVFPISENDRLFNEKDRTAERRTQAKNSTTIGDGSMRADNIVCVVQRGRNPEKPSDRTTGTHTEQRLEPNSQGTTNTLTGVQKDNLILINSEKKKNYLQWDASGKGYNSQQDRAFYETGYMGTIPSTRTENKINVLTNTNAIRRLTEIECERLQGFPDGWTEYGNYDGKIKSIPKTQRYKMLGNAVTVDVVKAIGSRIIQANEK